MPSARSRSERRAVWTCSCGVDYRPGGAPVRLGPRWRCGPGQVFLGNTMPALPTTAVDERDIEAIGEP